MTLCTMNSSGATIHDVCTFYNQASLIQRALCTLSIKVQHLRNIKQNTIHINLITKYLTEKHNRSEFDSLVMASLQLQTIFSLFFFVDVNYTLQVKFSGIIKGQIYSDIVGIKHSM